MTNKKGCLFDGCAGPIYARRMCPAHYRGVKRGSVQLPVSQSSRTDWQEHAACQGINPELFFPISEDPSNPIVSRARAVCANCQVVLRCAEWALNSDLTHGMFGGLTSQERRRIRAAVKVAELESAEASAR